MCMVTTVHPYLGLDLAFLFFLAITLYIIYIYKLEVYALLMWGMY